MGEIYIYKEKVREKQRGQREREGDSVREKDRKKRE